MFPAITLRNLPLAVTSNFFKKVLRANQVQWEQVELCASGSAPESALEAHVSLRNLDAVQAAIRVMNGCEVADRILESCAASEAAIELLKAGSEKKHRKPQHEEKSREVLSPKKAPVAPSSRKAPDKSEHCVPFTTLGLSPVVLQNIERLGYKATTPIQGLAIPPAMEGRDIIGKAQTGTGKTLAFVIPIVERLLLQPGPGLRSMILAPTRELVIQIRDVFAQVTDGTGLRTVAVYGGDSILDQMLELRIGVNILIATPGRLFDLQRRGRLRFDATEILVLDEADRMLDMGFLPDVQTVFRCFYEHPQTMLFSATVPTALSALTDLHLESPVLVEAGPSDLTPLDSVTQEVVYVSRPKKENYLCDLLNREEGPTIVFARTKRSTEGLARRLRSAGYMATRIHGDISQTDRLKSLKAFREGKYRILVATDVASRGLDIEGITHVVNYDLPRDPEDHLHRIGRTARAGANGKATTFVTQAERHLLKDFKTVLGQQ
ncbi:MAG: DEAD/DEAH box helicase [bacterium]